MITYTMDHPSGREWIELRDEYDQLVARVSSMDPVWPEIRLLAEKWFEEHRNAPRYVHGMSEEIALETQRMSELVREGVALIYRARCSN